MSQFLKWINSSPAVMRYVMITSVIAMLYFVLQKLHHRDGVADFRVYYDAAEALIHGKQVYGIPFGVGSGFYKYSPFAALPFIPFTFLPYMVASGIYYFLILAAFILFSLVLVYFLERRFEFPVLKRGWVLACVTVFLVDHFERELHLGNVNVLLLICSFGVFYLMRKSKWLGAGMLYAVILLYKPHFIILLPYFIWRKQWRLMAVSIVGIAIGLTLPVLLKGWTGNSDLLGQWIAAIRDHNVHLQQSPNTIYGIYTRFILDPLQLVAGGYIIPLLISVVAILFLWFLIRNSRIGNDDRFVFIEYFILIALIPNLTHTDTEHFMWTWPLITFTMLTLFYSQVQRKWLYIVLLVLAFIPYCINSPDIVGRKLMLLFDEGGLLGIANLIIISVSVALFSKMKGLQAEA